MRPHLLVLWTIFFLLEVSSSFRAAKKARPHRVTPCACRYKGVLYDLSKLARGDGRPRFTIASAEKDNSYSYNPCIPFSITSNISTEYNCHNVAICYWSKDGQRRDPLGYQHPREISCRASSDERVSLVYLQGGHGRLLNYTTTIEMVCDRSKKCPNEATIKLKSGHNSAIPTFQVFHQCCCPEGCVTCPDSKPYMLYIEIGAGFGGLFLIVISCLGGYFIAKKRYHGRDDGNGAADGQERPAEGGGMGPEAGDGRRNGRNGDVDFSNNMERQNRGGRCDSIAIPVSCSQSDSASYMSTQSGSIPSQHDERESVITTNR